MDGTQGEMNGMTTWEQIVSKPDRHSHTATTTPTTTYTNTNTAAVSRDDVGGVWSTSSSSSSTTLLALLLDVVTTSRGIQATTTLTIKQLRSRDVLCVVPTVLAHASCHVAKYQSLYVIINVGVWAMVMVPKLPFMNGVRILGINRTAGIDDGSTTTSCQEEEEEEGYDDHEDTTEEDVVIVFDDGNSKKSENEPKKNK